MVFVAVSASERENVKVRRTDVSVVVKFPDCEADPAFVGETEGESPLLVADTLRDMEVDERSETDIVCVVLTVDENETVPKDELESDSLLVASSVTVPVKVGVPVASCVGLSDTVPESGAVTVVVADRGFEKVCVAVGSRVIVSDWVIVAVPSSVAVWCVTVSVVEFVSLSVDVAVSVAETSLVANGVAVPIVTD
jgi:hypothetical protein